MNNWLDQWSNLWVFLTAIGTLAMAVTTVLVIRQTAKHHRALLTQQSKEHMDRFKPICFLAPYSAIDPLNQRHGLIAITDPPLNNPAFGTIALNCTLQNVGFGPALKLHITFRSVNGDTTDPWELSPLATGEKYGSTTAPLLIPLQADKRHLFAVSWQIQLDYEDIFGRKFKTVHSSMTFHTDPSTYTWITVDGQQKAKIRPIPWTTYQEM